MTKKAIIIDPITDATETAAACTVRQEGGSDRVITDRAVIRALYDSRSAQSFGDGSYTVSAEDLYCAVEGRGERLEGATFTSTWPNGNDPDGSTVVTIYASGAPEIGYILKCEEEVYAGGDPRQAGLTVFPTLDAALAFAKDYAETHDEA